MSRGGGVRSELNLSRNLRDWDLKSGREEM